MDSTAVFNDCLKAQQLILYKIGLCECSEEGNYSCIWIVQRYSTFAKKWSTSFCILQRIYKSLLREHIAEIK